MKKKKLRLHRVTIANLTSAALKNVLGGVTGPTIDAGVVSIQVDDKFVPCQPPVAEGG